MIYRKTPPQPGRLLLRVVAATGAATLLGVVACGSSGEGPFASTGSASGSTGAGAGYEFMVRDRMDRSIDASRPHKNI
jgi:hypothetical protein